MMVEIEVKRKPYIFKVMTRYHGVEFTLYEGKELLVTFALFEEADKIPEDEKALKDYVDYLLFDLKQLEPFLKKLKI